MVEEGNENIHYVSRDNRNGYKVGALKEAMELEYVKKCKYVVAIFDEDHQTPCDFLMQTIPFFIHNPKIALVQARWIFVNADECIMTRIQEMSLNYHFKVEQQSGSSTLAFFGFNGTAGVWRILALNEAEVWKERTTVEDMDLAIRATLRGWKFVYIGDLEVKCELPSTYKAYRNQQHRWACGPANLFKKMACPIWQVKCELPSTYKAYRNQQHRWACGPANLFKKMAWDIVKAEKVSLWRKFFLLYNFFFARRIVSLVVTFFFYCVVITLSIFFPEVEIPTWGVVHIPVIITILIAAGTPSSLYLTFIWIFFENVMSLHRCKAVYIGLFDAGRVNEWVVTEKLGNMLKTKPVATAAKYFQKKFWERLFFLEIVMGIYLFLCAYYDYVFRTNQYYIFIFPLSISFFLMGFG